MSFCLLVVLLSISIVHGQENFVITVGENKEFSECNFHDLSPTDYGTTAEVVSTGNTAYVNALADIPYFAPNPSGGWFGKEWEESYGAAAIGIKYNLDFKQYQFSDVADWPVKLTIDFSYTLEFKTSPPNAEGLSTGCAGVSLWVYPNWPGFNPYEGSFYELLFSDESSGIYETKVEKNAVLSTETTVGDIYTLPDKLFACYIDAVAQTHFDAPFPNYARSEVTINSIKVEFPGINQPPSASFSYLPQSPKVNEEISFDASSSSDSDGTIAKYTWDFGDGTAAEELTAAHVYTQAGSYTVTLTVTDDRGLIDTSSLSFEVIAKCPLDKQLPQDKITSVGEPINVASGNMFTSAVDIAISSSRLSLELCRSYNSQDEFAGSFGYGWRSNFDISLAEQPDGSVIEVEETGVYTIFSRNPDGTYSASAGKYSELNKNPDGSYQIIRKHGEKLGFNSSGLLRRIEDRNANYIEILRDGNGIISEVSDSTGRKLLFTADAQGKISQVIDPAGRAFKYEYDAEGNLTKAIDPLNQEMRYQYDSSHNLIQKSDANNHALYFAYDANDRAYHSWQESNNNEVSLSFNPANKTTSSTDSLGNITKYEYNDYGLVTKITDSQNNTQSFGWDENLNKTSSTSQNGFTTIFSYDLRGNLLSVSDALSHTTTFSYEPNFDFIASTTDALGNTTTYSYDPKGNLLQTKDTLNNITTYSYDTQGLLTQTKDANNNLTLFDYDSFGNLTKVTDSLNNETTFTYDIIGNKTQVTDAQNNTTNFTYDELNRLTLITYPDSSMVTYAYDPAGNLIASTDQNNNTTTYVYDTADRLTQTTDAQANTAAYTYDTEGSRTAITDSAGNITQYSYDSLNRLIKTEDALGNQTLFSCDPVGNLIAKTDANGNTINYTYDALDRVITVRDANAGIIQYQYDSIGNRTSITDANGNITSYIYDSLSRLIKTTFPDTSFEAYIYDNLGNILQKQTRKGDCLNFSYDSLNRLISKTYPDTSKVSYTYDSLSRLITAADSSGTITHSYNNLGRLISVRYPNDMVVSYEYDPAGNRTKLVYPDAAFLTYTYDSLNRVTKITDQFSNTIAAFSYDNLSRRTTLTLVNGAAAAYTYDPLSRLVSLTNQRSPETISSFSYSYDSVGNRLSMITQQGNYNYAYDKLSQMTVARKPDLSMTAYSFDPLGNRQNVVSGSTQSYTSNNLNQYTQIIENGITTNLTYNKNGSLISKETLRQSGNPIKKLAAGFSYDYENRLREITMGHQTVSFNYDAFGRRTSKKINKKIQEKYIYDDENVILDLDSHNKISAKYIYGPDTDEPLVMIKGADSYYYSKDGLGSVINLTDSSGSVVEAYSYDEYGMPLNNMHHTANRYLYTGREFDAETNLYYYRARYYDPAIGRFLQADPLGIDEENTYTYCYNSPVNYTDPFGLQGENIGIGLGGVMPPVTGKPKPGIWQPPSSDILPMPELPPQEETNTNIRSKTKAKQLGISESIIHAATEGVTKKTEIKKNGWKENFEDLLEKLKKFLGEGARLIKNKFGDIILVSKDGLRRVRFDIKNPLPHDKPHGHVEIKVDGQWQKSGPIYFK